MAVLNPEMTTEKLLGLVSQLSEKEFQRFLAEAKNLHRQPSKNRWTKREAEIIRAINESVLLPEKQARYNELVKKREAQELTKIELEELVSLTDETEELNVRRLENLVKLSRLSKKTVDEIMQELEIFSAAPK